MRDRKTLKAYLFIAPALLIALVFYIYPFLKSFIFSFLTINQRGHITGFAFLENYKTLFRDKAFINSVRNTLRFTILFVPLNTLLTVGAATLTRKTHRFSSIAETIFFTPMAISLSGASLIFSLMFRGRVSIVNRIFHLSIEWLGERAPAMLVLVLLGVFLDFGIDFILLLTALKSNDKSVLEAAELDGAENERLFFCIELPMIKNIVIATVFLAIKDALLIVAPIMIVTEGGPFRSTETMMFYYYIEAFKSGNRAIANTLSVLLVAFAALLMTISTRKREK